MKTRSFSVMIVAGVLSASACGSDGQVPAADSVETVARGDPGNDGGANHGP